MSGSADTTFMNVYQSKSDYVDIELKKTTDIPDYLKFISIENSSNYPQDLSPSDPNLDTPQATDEDTVFLTAGKIDDCKFNITNNNNHPIQNVAVTLIADTELQKYSEIQNGSSIW